MAWCPCKYTTSKTTGGILGTHTHTPQISSPPGLEEEDTLTTDLSGGRAGRWEKMGCNRREGENNNVGRMERKNSIRRRPGRGKGAGEEKEGKNTQILLLLLLFCTPACWRASNHQPFPPWSLHTHTHTPPTPPEPVGSPGAPGRTLTPHQRDSFPPSVSVLQVPDRRWCSLFIFNQKEKLCCLIDESVRGAHSQNLLAVNN